MSKSSSTRDPPETDRLVTALVQAIQPVTQAVVQSAEAIAEQTRVQAVRDQQRQAAEDARQAQQEEQSRALIQLEREKLEFEKQRHAEQRQQRDEERKAKARELKPEDEKLITLLQITMTQPSKATTATILTAVEELVLRLVPRTHEDRRTVVATILGRAKLDDVAVQFDGSDEALKPGTPWMRSLLTRLGIALPHFGMITPPTSATTFGPYMTSNYFLLAWLERDISEANSAAAAADRVMARYLMAHISADAAHAPIMAELESVVLGQKTLEAVARNTTVATTRMLPHSRNVKSDSHRYTGVQAGDGTDGALVPTRQLSVRAPVFVTAAETAAAMATAAAQFCWPQLMAARQQFWSLTSTGTRGRSGEGQGSVTRAKVHLGLPRGPLTAVDAVIDSGSTLTLVSPSFVEQHMGSGVLAVSESAAPLAALRGAAGITEFAVPLKPIMIEVSTDGGAARPAEAFVVDNLPVPALLGVDVLGSVVGGTTICIDAKGNSTVQFGTGVDSSLAHFGPDPKAGGAARVTSTPNASSASQATTDPLLLFVTALDGKVMTVELEEGLGVAAQDGALELSERQCEQIAAAVAITLANVGTEQELIFELGHAVEDVTPVYLTVPALSHDVPYDPDVDVPPVAAASGVEFKYKAAIDKLDEMVDAVDSTLGGFPMPASERQRLKSALRQLDLRLASKEAPPPRPGFLNHPDAVVRLRFRPNAQLDQIKTRLFPLPLAQKQAVDKQVDEWLRAGVMKEIEPGDTRTVSQPIVAPKYNPAGEITGYRIAIDLRQLNKQLEPDRLAPVQRLQLAQRAVKADAVTVIDMFALFNQMPVAEEYQRFYTVHVGGGRYYKMAGSPFGDSQRPAHAQFVMQKHVVCGDSDKLGYIDDVAILHEAPVAGARDAVAAWAPAVDQLILFFTRCAKINMAVNIDKMQLLKNQANLLGYVIDCSTHTFTVHPKKLASAGIVEMPQNNKRLKSWLSTINAHAHAVPGAALLLARLRAIIKHGSPLEWTDDGRAAWHELVRLVSGPAALVPWNEHEVTYLWTDGCDSGVGYVITQLRGGRHMLVVAGGRRTKQWESRLTTPELEVLAADAAVRAEPDKLVQPPGGVTWLTDSQAALLARNQKGDIASAAVRKIIAQLSSRGFAGWKIQKIPGKSNLADAYSRQWEQEGPESEPELLVTMTTGETGLKMSQSQQQQQQQTAEVVEQPQTPAPPSTSESAHDTAGQSLAEPATPALEYIDDDILRDEPEAADPTPEQIRAIEEVLQSPELAPAVSREQREWADAQARDTSPFMEQARRQQQGEFVGSHSMRKKRFVRDGSGRLFNEEGGRLRLVVPETKLRNVLTAIHINTGHKAVHSMMLQFNEHFYHPRAGDVAKEVVDECMPCQMVNRKPSDGVIGFDPTPYGRFEKVALDVMEIRGSGDVMHGLMMIDVNTGAIEVVPMKGKTADHICEAFVEGWLKRFPIPPRVVQFDNDQANISEAVKRLMGEYGITIDPISARNPQANGVVERAIGLFKGALRKVVPMGADWTKYVGTVRKALMSTVSRARGGHSPMELVYGVKPVVAEPAQVGGDEQPPTAVVERGKKAEAKWRRQRLAKLSTEANAARAKQNAAAVKAALKKAEVQPGEFKVGQIVFVEAEPYHNATKWDKKIKRSRQAEIIEIDTKRKRARVRDWATRQEFRSFVPLRRLSAVRGGAGAQSEKVAQQLPPREQREQKSAQAQAVEGVEVATDHGYIVNVTDLVDGRRVLLVPPTSDGSGPDWSQPLTEVPASLLPAKLVQEAWRLKHLLRAPKSFVQGARAKQNQSTGEGEAPMIK